MDSEPLFDDCRILNLGTVSRSLHPTRGCCLPFGIRIVLTIVENDEIGTNTSIPTTSSQKRVTRHVYSPEELEVQLLR